MTALLIDDPAYFDQLARIERDHWWSRGLWKISSAWLDQALRGKSKLVALDIGCGAGGTLRRLADRSEIQSVFGLDPSFDALQHAAMYDVSLGSALNLPFADDTFDFITCFDVLQHLSQGEDSLALSEVERVLRPGGVAIIRSNGRGLWPDRSRQEVAYDLRVLIRTVRNAGLVVRRATYANCLPAIATELLGRFRRDHGHPQGRGLRIREARPKHARLMGVVAMAEAFAITRLGMSLPVGHSTMLLVEKPKGTNR